MKVKSFMTGITYTNLVAYHLRAIMLAVFPTADCLSHR